MILSDTGWPDITTYGQFMFRLAPNRLYLYIDFIIQIDIGYPLLLRIHFSRYAMRKVSLFSNCCCAIVRRAVCARFRYTKHRRWTQVRTQSTHTHRRECLVLQPRLFAVLRQNNCENDIHVCKLPIDHNAKWFIYTAKHRNSKDEMNKWKKTKIENFVPQQTQKKCFPIYNVWCLWFILRCSLIDVLLFTSCIWTVGEQLGSEVPLFGRT